MNWFTRGLAKLNIGIVQTPVDAKRSELIEPLPIHDADPVPEVVKVDPPKPPVSWTLEDIMKVVNSRQVDRKVILRGKLFEYVSSTYNSVSPMDGKGNFIIQLCHMSEDYHMAIEHQVVPEEYYPRCPDDIETPGDWIDHINQCYNFGYLMNEMVYKMEWTLKLMEPGTALQFIYGDGGIFPILKLYTNLDWIDAGWQGPAIVVDCHGDRRTPAARGMIPDNLKTVSLVDQFAEIEKFRTGPLTEMLPNHSSVDKFNKAYAAFTKFLDEQSITYR